MTIYKVDEMENGALIVTDSGKEMDVMDYTIERKSSVTDSVIVLENGTELFTEDWNGEVYIIVSDETEMEYRPVYKPYEDDPDSFDVVGYVEV